MNGAKKYNIQASVNDHTTIRKIEQTLTCRHFILPIICFHIFLVILFKIIQKPIKKQD